MAQRGWDLVRDYVELASESPSAEVGARGGGQGRGLAEKKVRGFHVDEDNVRAVLAMVRDRMSAKGRRQRGETQRKEVVPGSLEHVKSLQGKLGGRKEREEAQLAEEERKSSASWDTTSVGWGGEKEDDRGMLVLECEREGGFTLCTDVTRHMLLHGCRTSAELHFAIPGPGGGRMGSALQLRDLRRLTGLTEQSVFVRRGACVAVLGVLHCVITHSKAFVVVSDGEEQLLIRLVQRMSSGDAGERSAPFEFFFLESLLHTVASHLTVLTRGCEDDVGGVTVGMHRFVSGMTVQRTWELRRRINEVTRQITGTAHALEQLQEDNTQIHLLYLTAQRRDPARHAELCMSGGGNTGRARNLVDTYVTELHTLSSALLLAAKQLDATEDLISLLLAVSRNNLWKVDILVTMSTMWIACSTFLTSSMSLNVSVGGELMYASPYDHTKWKDCGDCTHARGPSWIWVDVTAVTGFGALMLIIMTGYLLWRHGYLRS